MLNPISHSLDNNEANLYQVEPYVIAADVYGQEPHTGRGGWTWYTGSSGWFYRLSVEAILGFSTAGDHIKIDPCIPENWDGFSLNYFHNGSNYQIQVKNPDHVQKSVQSIAMDNKTLEDHKIPFVGEQADHEIIVILGN